MSLSLSGAISLEDPVSIAKARFVADLIALKNPTHWWPCNERATAPTGASNNGKRGQISSMQGSSATFDASAPMDKEPNATAVSFDGTDDFLFDREANDVPGFSTGTIFAFVRPRNTASGTPTIYAATDEATGTDDLSMFIDVSNADWRIQVVDAGSTVMELVLDVGSLKTNAWSLIAFRQGGGSDQTAWLNGKGYTLADSELTMTVTTDPDAWLNIPANTAHGIGGFLTGAAATDHLDGAIFNMVVDNTVWTDNELNELWQRAIANGLNV